MTSRLAAWLALVGAYTVLAYLSRAASGNPPDDLLYRYSTAVAGLAQYIVLLAIVLWITRGPAQRDLLALRRPRSWWHAAGLSLAVIVAIYAMTLLLEPFLHAGKEQGLTPPSWDPDRAGAYAANFAVIALVTPIVEELMFRGAGYSLLVPFGQGVAIAVVGLTFGLVHGLVHGLVILAAFGAGLAWLRAKTDSVYPCMAVHALFNSIALVIVVTT
jgi:membrane protease YdiL (CAAX protease family)